MPTLDNNADLRSHNPTQGLTWLHDTSLEPRKQAPGDPESPHLDTAYVLRTQSGVPPRNASMPMIISQSLWLGVKEQSPPLMCNPRLAESGRAMPRLTNILTNLSFLRRSDRVHDYNFLAWAVWQPVKAFTDGWKLVVELA